MAAAKSPASAASSPAKKALVQQGVDIILDTVVKDLKGEDGGKQLQALAALQGLTAPHAGGGRSSAFQAIQDAFRQRGGFPPLVRLLEAAVKRSGSRPEAGQADALAALEALAALSRNNTKNRAAAAQAGAVPAVCQLLGSGEARPPSIAVLQALYVLVAGDAAGLSTSEMFASGGIHALVRLLGVVLDNTAEPDSGLWVRELLALLYPLARRSRIVTHLLVAEMATLARLLIACTDPLTLSLGLDIMEEMLLVTDRLRARQAIAAEGGVIALVRAMHLKGIGTKAALLLAALASDYATLHMLRAVLQAADLNCLCHIAVLAADAEDLDAAPVRQLIELLLNTEELSIIRGLILGRCVGMCLSLPVTKSILLARATSDAGLKLLSNLGVEALVESAIAAAELFAHSLSCGGVLQRAGRVPALVAAAVAECQADYKSSAPGIATAALGHAVQALPAQFSRLTVAAGSQLSDDINNGGAGGTSPDAPAVLASPFANGLPLPQHQQQQSAKVGAEDAQQLPPGSDAAGGADQQRYLSVPFIVGGQEFLALAWVLEQASPIIAAALAQVADPAAAKVVVPPIAGLPDQRMYDMFGLAVEHCYTGSMHVLPEDVLDLWVVAAHLQMRSLREFCEGMLAESLEVSGDNLETAWTTAAIVDARGSGGAGSRLLELCTQFLFEHFLDLAANGVVQRLAHRNAATLTASIADLLQRRLKGLFGDAPSRSSSVAAEYLTPKASSITDILGRSGSFPDFSSGSQHHAALRRSPLGARHTDRAAATMQRGGIGGMSLSSSTISEIEPAPEEPPGS